MVKQWLHLALSFVLYLSTVGISVHSHYCQNELKDVSLLIEAESCHSVKKHCPHHPPQDNEKRDCCDNKVSFEKMDTELFSLATNHLPDVEFIASDLPIQLKNQHIQSEMIFAIQKYRPPPEQLPLHIQYQSFLC